MFSNNLSSIISLYMSWLIALFKVTSRLNGVMSLSFFFFFEIHVTHQIRKRDGANLLTVFNNQC